MLEVFPRDTYRKEIEELILSGKHPWPMRISCPRCGTNYELDSSLFGKRVQCEVCSFKFEITRDNFTSYTEPKSLPGDVPWRNSSPSKPKPQITRTTRKTSCSEKVTEGLAFVFLAVWYPIKLIVVGLALILVVGICLCCGGGLNIFGIFGILGGRRR